MIKLSKLTVATRVYRGVAGMRMPASFFQKDAYNLSGGVEYGFSSTTRKRAQATIYAKESRADMASTLLEAQMGMVDRGADIGFASQFPGCVACHASQPPRRPSIAATDALACLCTCLRVCAARRRFSMGRSPPCRCGARASTARRSWSRSP